VRVAEGAWVPASASPALMLRSFLTTIFYIDNDRLVPLDRTVAFAFNGGACRSSCVSQDKRRRGIGRHLGPDRAHHERP
jgi:hypothetical protein